MRDYTDRQVNQPMQVTSPTWGPSPPCKQALNQMLFCRSRCRRRRRYLRSLIFSGRVRRLPKASMAGV